MKDRTTRRRRFAVLRGGRDDATRGGDDWQAFCDRIGWQAIGDAPLPNDYEEQLAARIFGRSDGNVVSLAHERALRHPVVCAPALPALADEPQAARRSARWCALAVLALVAAGALWVAAGDDAAPPAATMPLWAPEIRDREIWRPPVEVDEAPAPQIPDPGVRVVKKPAPRRPTTEVVRERMPDRERAPEVAPVVAAVAAADFDPDPDADPRDALAIDVMALPYLAPLHGASLAAVEGAPASGAPDWLTLDAPLADAAAPMALVDLVAAGRRIGQL